MSQGIYARGLSYMPCITVQEWVTKVVVGCIRENEPIVVHAYWPCWNCGSQSHSTFKAGDFRRMTTFHMENIDSHLFIPMMVECESLTCRIKSGAVVTAIFQCVYLVE